jgi:hypothetical protein
VSSTESAFGGELTEYAVDKLGDECNIVLSLHIFLSPDPDGVFPGVLGSTPFLGVTYPPTPDTLL